MKTYFWYDPVCKIQAKVDYEIWSISIKIVLLIFIDVNEGLDILSTYIFIYNMINTKNNYLIKTMFYYFA